MKCEIIIRPSRQTMPISVMKPTQSATEGLISWPQTLDNSQEWAAGKASTDLDVRRAAEHLRTRKKPKSYTSGYADNTDNAASGTAQAGARD